VVWRCERRHAWTDDVASLGTSLRSHANGVGHHKRRKEHEVKTPQSDHGTYCCTCTLPLSWSCVCSGASYAFDDRIVFRVKTPTGQADHLLAIRSFIRHPHRSHIHSAHRHGRRTCDDVRSVAVNAHACVRSELAATSRISTIHFARDLELSTMTDVAVSTSILSSSLLQRHHPSRFG
jgi:hypothetical protein